MSAGQTATAPPAPPPLPCAACKQPVVEIRSAGGALVVLDAATKRLHLCVKRKEVEAAKAKLLTARARPVRPAKPLPPAKRPEPSTPTKGARPPRPSKPVEGRADRPARPVRARAAKPARPAPPRPKPVPTTLRSREQVEAILKGRIVRWRAGDGPTSFCGECDAPVLVGFSHVRWDVMVLDAAGLRPHDCEQSRAAAALLKQPPSGRIVPDLPEVAKRVTRAPRPVAPIGSPPMVKPEAKPRRRAASSVTPRSAANSCDTCGNLKALVMGTWVCRHCGA